MSRKWVCECDVCGGDLRGWSGWARIRKYEWESLLQKWSPVKLDMCSGCWERFVKFANQKEGEYEVCCDV